jgi:hypothetical protein
MKLLETDRSMNHRQVADDSLDELSAHSLIPAFRAFRSHLGWAIGAMIWTAGVYRAENSGIRD